MFQPLAPLTVPIASSNIHQQTDWTRLGDNRTYSLVEGPVMILFSAFPAMLCFGLADYLLSTSEGMSSSRVYLGLGVLAAAIAALWMVHGGVIRMRRTSVVDVSMAARSVRIKRRKWMFNKQTPIYIPFAVARFESKSVVRMAGGIGASDIDGAFDVSLQLPDGEKALVAYHLKGKKIVEFNERLRQFGLSTNLHGEKKKMDKAAEESTANKLGQSLIALSFLLIYWTYNIYSDGTSISFGGGPGGYSGPTRRTWDQALISASAATIVSLVSMLVNLLRVKSASTKRGKITSVVLFFLSFTMLAYFLNVVFLNDYNGAPESTIFGW